MKRRHYSYSHKGGLTFSFESRLEASLCGKFRKLYICYLSSKNPKGLAFIKSRKYYVFLLFNVYKNLTPYGIYKKSVVYLKISTQNEKYIK